MTDAEIDGLDGPELGIACATHIMGWPKEDQSRPDNPIPHYWLIGLIDKPIIHIQRSKLHSLVWQPWEDLNAAWEIVEKVMCTARPYYCNVRFADWFNKADLWACDGPQAARDICRAALKAKFAKGGD